MNAGANSVDDRMRTFAIKTKTAQHDLQLESSARILRQTFLSPTTTCDRAIDWHFSLHNIAPSCHAGEE